MVENKLINIVMSYGADSYFIKIEELELNEENRYCLNGYYKLNSNNQKYTFCKTTDETTITFH